MYWDIIPNKAGIIITPIYANAICIPIIACEFSFPKLSGVACITDGYIGAHPNPTKPRPIRENMNILKWK